MSEGIHRIPIPTPFAVGRVNVYLIEDEPLTLVDTGPNSATSFDELTTGLAALGHALEDIELVIVTHQHIDHLGLVSLVAQRSGAEVAAIDALAPYVENFSQELGEARGKIASLEKELIAVGTDLANTRAQLDSESTRARRATEKWDRDRVSLERAKDALAEALTRIEEAEHEGG